MVGTVAAESWSPEFCRSGTRPYLMERCNSAENVNGAKMLQRWLSAVQETG
jgi:hypothetical protein